MTQPNPSLPQFVENLLRAEREARERQLTELARQLDAALLEVAALRDAIPAAQPISVTSRLDNFQVRIARLENPPV